MEDLARTLLMFVVVPLWVAAGTADWACHRRTHIATTSGLPENLFHWLLLAQAGALLLAVALLEITAGVLLLGLALFLAHELTTWVELRYAVPRREVRPIEQMVHSFMEILPLAILLLAGVSAGEQVLALAGEGRPDWGLRPKAQPWPPAYLLGLAGAVLLLDLLPMAEETLRCVRARPRR
jgi:hypothetical protein